MRYRTTDFDGLVCNQLPGTRYLARVLLEMPTPNCSSEPDSYPRFI
jgi:hypothetical protein